MFICQKSDRVHGQIRVGNPCIRQTMLCWTEDAPANLEGWTRFLVSVDMKTFVAALPASSSRSVVGCNEKLYVQCCHWLFKPLHRCHQ